MSEKPIRWGIFGTSPISKTMALAIKESSFGDLVAIGSRSSLRASDFAKEFSIPKYYDDYEALLCDSDIDVVYLGLPNHVHKEWILKAAQAKKHILCEKPLVLNESEALEAISATKQANIFCMEALMYRCHPLTYKLKELTDSGIIGDIKLFNAVYTADIVDRANPVSSGSIFNLGCYPTSLVRLLVKSEPIEILAHGRISGENRADRQASAILKFNNDSLAMISLADDMTMHWRFDVYGTKGKISALTNPWMPQKTSRLEIELAKQNKPSIITVTTQKSVYSCQIDALNECVQKRGACFIPISLRDSLNNTIVLRTWRDQITPNLTEKFRS